MHSIFVYMLKRYFPILEWLPKYKKSYLAGDFSAGITVGIMLIPQGMAYALIAGLPPIYGLYAALVPNLIYVFTGSSRKLAVGPVALDSLIVASSLAAMKIANVTDYISMAIFLALFVGVIQLVMGFMRLGFLSNFLSRPVVSGFTSAAALVIGVSQLKHFFGLEISTNNTVKTLQAIFSQISETNFYDLTIGVAAVLVILGLKKLHRKLPAAMVVVILAIVGIYLFMVNDTDVHIVGQIPQGLPAFLIPELNVDMMVRAFPTAMALAFIAFAEAMTIAKAVEDKSQEYFTEPNQELRALGLSNIIGSFFQSFPANAGLSRTAVNVDEGAKTGIASLISVVVVGVTLLFLTPFFYYLPKSVLGAIIILAVYGLIDLKYPKQLWAQRKDEFYLFLVTFLTTLLIGISQGIIFGVLFSLLLLVYRISRPHIAVLGKIKGMEYFKNLKRFPEDVEVHDEILMIRFDAQLFFANVQYFKSQLMKEVSLKGDGLKYVILNAEPVNYIDNTALNQLEKTVENLKEAGIVFKIAGAIGPIRDILQKSGFLNVIGKENVYVRTAEAYEDCLKKMERTALQEKVSLQYK
ncbi:SulP family inorganic anion transporter [Croceitalea rosinachiae]|uniref:Solute carrier family 26 protein n=1 Tax=Croceitalea rosinachiae TaxID=3075596 RepID=A0ABU3AA34_9FLAO|nr:solute carrier family 26 protein [Croceitalea sp. F388]MDT0605938.1 solute carrier family 26 protein [Croceitalea sp. F388]